MRAARVAAVLVAESEVARVAEAKVASRAESMAEARAGVERVVVKWGVSVAGLEVVWAAEREAETCERENERRIGSALR